MNGHKRPRSAMWDLHYPRQVIGAANETCSDILSHLSFRAKSRNLSLQPK
jgi:hypothetical protein